MDGWKLADFRRHLPQIITERDELRTEVRRLREIADDVTTDNLLAEAQDEITDLVAERDAARAEAEQWRENAENASSYRAAAESDRDEARAEAEELRQAYRTVCDYAEQHDATRAELNEAVAEVEHLKLTVAALGKDRQRRIAEAARVREAPQARFDFEAHLVRQREFSDRTFGPGLRTEGVSDHIRKELDEIKDAPTDLCEWIDVVILGLDGAGRTGASPQQIISALAAKQQRNEQREWPDWRTAPADKAIEHVRALDAALDGETNG